MKTLIIVEKPSVARDISAVLGRFKKEGDTFENDEYIIAAAAGHLVELFMPEDIDKKKYGFWRLSELPIIPEKFKLKAIADKRNKDRLDSLKKLIKREDVDNILNACDAGREGELIFTYIYELANSKKPYQRVWMQSMTKGAIKEAFSQLRSAEQMQGLKDAARSRSEADWLIGINGTRAITKRMFGRGKGVATVGRVQTPTLSIVYQRELEIRNFTPRDYWRITGRFKVDSGEYDAVLQKAEPVQKTDPHDKADRIWKEDVAKGTLETLQAQTYGTAEDVKKRTRQSSGRLYDLTSLQREANGRYGFPAGRTLQLAQALYEKHKVLTYPRTDSRALPEDYVDTVRQTLANLDGVYGHAAGKVLDNGWVKMDKRIFNNAQVSDHFAIIPTGEKPSKLSTEEEKIYDMVTRRFIAIFFPPAEFDVTTRTTLVENLTFTTEGKVLIKPGYLEVYGKEAIDNELPPLTDADRTPRFLEASLAASLADKAWYAQPTDYELKAEQTKPPARYTEATLLSAMEGAGKLVDDEELALAMKEKGLGTPATRASTIEHLLAEKYMERDGRNLMPTTKAERLFEFLGAIQAEALTRPDLTGEWENKLLLMEQGKLSRKDFMKGISDLTHHIVDRVKQFEENIEDAPDSSIISPTDQKPMKEMLNSYVSQDKEITVYKTVAGRKFTQEEIQTLLKDRAIGPLDDFRSKAGKPFSATLRLDAMNKVSFDFGNGNNGGDGNGEPVDISTLTAIGTFKETGEIVYETPQAYACARNLKGERDKSFRISRTLLGKTLPKEEVTRLLEEGKTGLIEGFKSNRTKRAFDAFLVLKKNGGIGFEFPPRKPSDKPKKKTKSKTDASETED